MSDLRKAAEAALAAMDYMLNNGEWYQAQDRADALRAALAQPDMEMPKTLCGPNLEEVLNAAGFYKREPLTDEQEPVAWKVLEGTGVSYLSSEPPHPSVVAACRPLYTAPPQRKPLRTVIYACPICAASLERQE